MSSQSKITVNAQNTLYPVLTDAGVIPVGSGCVLQTDGQGVVELEVTANTLNQPLTISYSLDGLTFTALVDAQIYSVGDGVSLDTSTIAGGKTGFFIIPSYGRYVMISVNSACTGAATIQARTDISASGSGGVLSALQGILRVGSPISLLGATKQGGAVYSGILVAGANKIKVFKGRNTNPSTTYYLMFFDAASLPANATAPLMIVECGYGVSSYATEGKEVLSPDYIQFSTDVFYAWSTSDGTLTVAGTGAAGLSCEVYG